MPAKLEQSRDTWSDDKRYLIRASAKYWRPIAGAGIPRVSGWAEVFEGDPAITNNPAIFRTADVSNTGDLMDAMQSAEHIAREHIATLR